MFLSKAVDAFQLDLNPSSTRISPKYSPTHSSLRARFSGGSRCASSSLEHIALEPRALSKLSFRIRLASRFAAPRRDRRVPRAGSESSYGRLVIRRDFLR